MSKGQKVHEFVRRVHTAVSLNVTLLSSVFDGMWSVAGWETL